MPLRHFVAVWNLLQPFPEVPRSRSQFLVLAFCCTWTRAILKIEHKSKVPFAKWGFVADVLMFCFN